MTQKYAIKIRKTKILTKFNIENNKYSNSEIAIY